MQKKKKKQEVLFSGLNDSAASVSAALRQLYIYIFVCEKHMWSAASGLLECFRNIWWQLYSQASIVWQLAHDRVSLVPRQKSLSGQCCKGSGSVLLPCWAVVSNRWQEEINKSRCVSCFSKMLALLMESRCSVVPQQPRMFLTLMAFNQSKCRGDWCLPLPWPERLSWKRSHQEYVYAAWY